jgi:transcriptional regulator with XRE-family HTH domain
MRSADIVKALRADKVSQAELACRAGLSRETVSRWDRGRRLHVASVPDLLQIAEHSTWSEDAIYRTGLRAVLVCEHYHSEGLPGLRTAFA